MLSLQQIGYHHPNKDLLFDNISLNISTQQKIALIGNNGAGKSTLIRLIAGELKPSGGTIKADGRICYVPQVYGGSYNNCSIAEALGIAPRLQALQAILAGDTREDNYTLLDDDWNIEERCREALDWWGLEHIDLNRKMDTLSGGQKTKVFLAAIRLHDPRIVLMDEPSNHLDVSARDKLYDYIRSTRHTLIVVSHDRFLLNLLPSVAELSSKGLTLYGGNYDFYTEQKAIKERALIEDMQDKEKALRKARDVERETIERQQKMDARGRKKQEQAGLPTISMNTFRNNAEQSTARLKDVHAAKTNMIVQDLQLLRQALPDKDKMKLGFDESALHKGKILVTATDVNYNYGQGPLWQRPLNFQIRSGQRLAIKGCNGSGKTTLINMLTGLLQPTAGNIDRAVFRVICLDQDYALINNRLTILDQARLFNTAHLQEHEIKSRLTHFLFTNTYWDKPCGSLSGGEKMRLMLCCLSLGNDAPDMIVLDEPTNNLDIRNIDILTAAIKDYAGTLLVISHDVHFTVQSGVTHVMDLDQIRNTDWLYELK